MSDLLRHLGITVEFKDNTMTIDVPDELSWDAPAELVRKMRASSLVLGPLVARCGKAILPLPGVRARKQPIDFHLKGLAKMGAEIDRTRDRYMPRQAGSGERITRLIPLSALQRTS